MYDSMDYSLFISILIDSVVLHYKTKFCWPAYDRKVSVFFFWKLSNTGGSEPPKLIYGVSQNYPDLFWRIIHWVGLKQIFFCLNEFLQ